MEGLEERRGLVAELAETSNAAERLSLLQGRKDIQDAGLVSLLYGEVVRLARVDIRQADRLARSACWIAGRLRDDYCRAQGHRASGHVQLMKGKYFRAVQSYGKALTLFRSLGREAEVGRTLYGGSLQALIYLGRYDQALAWALEARGIFERLGDRLRLARLDANMGNVLYRQDRFEEALDYYGRAYKEFLSLGEPEDIAIALRNMAVCHISLTNFEEALKTYREARAHCSRNGLPLLVAEVDYNIAYLHYQRGEYGRAVELYQSTRKHCRRLGDPYHEALCDLDQSEMYLELNEDEEGARLAERAACSFRKLGMRYEEAKALSFLAIAASHQARAQQALDLFARARELFAGERNRVWVAMTNLYQAVVLSGTGLYARARRLNASALAFFSESTLQSKAALCELLQARLLLQERQYAEARRSCARALKRLGETEAPAVTCQAYLTLGHILEVQGRRKQARAAYEKAHALLEDLRSHLRGEELKISFLKDKLAVYESLVWMSLHGERRPRKEAAFAYIEQAKSRSLADLIAFREVDLSTDRAEGELSQRVKKLRVLVNWYNRQIESVETRSPNEFTPRLEYLKGFARDCEEKLVKALSEMRHRDQHFGVLHNAGTVGIESVRSILSGGDVLLEYYQSRKILYACVLTRRTLEIVPVAHADTVRDLLRLLRFQLSKFRLGPDYVRRFAGTLREATCTHLRDLYDNLILPVQDRLKGEHLIVVPHDFLHTLPFHALHGGGSYLIDRFSISYAPSASVYYLCHVKPSTSGTGSLILGIPDSLSPRIDDEVGHVAARLPNPLLFIGKDATEERLRTHGPRSRFVHIATHGVFRQDHPALSSMKLGDSQLRLSDLYSLQLSSDLVTLSGCSTGLHAVVGGDELLGLVRGLLYAGTRAILVSLWDVDDQSTAEFMKSFYSHRMSEPDMASAVRTAMRELRTEYNHPYHWAPFILIGKAASS